MDCVEKLAAEKPKTPSKSRMLALTNVPETDIVASPITSSLVACRGDGRVTRHSIFSKILTGHMELERHVAELELSSYVVHFVFFYSMITI